MRKFIENVEACINEPNEINLDDVKMSIGGARVEVLNIEYAFIEAKHQIKHLEQLLKTLGADVSKTSCTSTINLIETTIKHLKG